MGKLFLDDCAFVGSGVGVRAPSDMDIHARKTQFLDVNVGFDLYDPKFREIAGLPKDVKNELVEEVVALLKANPDASNEEMTKIVETSRLGTWLGTIDAVTKAATGLIAFVKAGVELIK